MRRGGIEHAPVLLEEVLAWLQPAPGKRFLDGTLGLGGHALALLERSGGGAEVLGLDMDGEAMEQAVRRIEAAGYGARLQAFHLPFAELESALCEAGWSGVDGALLDLGLSALQVEDPARGFSFIQEGPLDMRMDREHGGQTAGGLVNRASQAELRDIIRDLGEEPMAGRIARAIVEARRRGRIQGTLELAEIVSRAYPGKRRAQARNHPATKTFQALRIAVNRELQGLAAFLERIPGFLSPGGRLAVIAFHSLEDRLVKHALRREAQGCVCPPRQPVCTCGHRPRLKVLTKKPIEAGPAERESNPRSRSAKMRVAESLRGSG